MRRYRFALEPVLRVRRIQQDSVQALVATARVGYEQADVVLERSVEHYHARCQPTGAETTARWLAGRAGADLAAASVMAAGVERETARQQLDEHLDGLRAARMRVTALERLDGRRRDEHALESRRAEDAETDELVSARHRPQEATS